MIQREKREIFRKAALDRLSSPEQLDLLAEIAPARTWMAFAGLCGLVVAAAVWAAFAREPVVVRASGRIGALPRLAELRLRQAGHVAALAVREGDRVRPGRLLARVSDVDLRRAAEAGVARRSPGAQAGLESEIAALAAEDTQARAIRAPWPGTVVAVLAGVGDSVDAGAPVLVLRHDAEARPVAVLSLDEAPAGAVRPGQTVRLRPWGGGEAGGVVARVGDLSAFTVTGVPAGERLVFVDLRPGPPVPPATGCEGEIVVSRRSALAALTGRAQAAP